MRKILSLIVLVLSLSLAMNSQGNYPCTTPGPAGTLFSSGGAAVSGAFNICSAYSPALEGVTITDCFVVTSSAEGTLGAVQLFTNSGPTSCDATIANSRMAELYLPDNCGGTPIAINVANAGNSSTFNPEWNQLCPNTTYTLCVTTTIPSGCPYT